MSMVYFFKNVVFTFEFDNLLAKVKRADCFAH